LQLDLIERRVARNGRVVSVPFRSKIDTGFPRHDYMHAIMPRRDGQFVGRVQGRLRRDERPGANAGVGCSGVNGGNQYKQR
jgi:hypothetical protein